VLRYLPREEGIDDGVEDELHGLDDEGEDEGGEHMRAERRVHVHEQVRSQEEERKLNGDGDGGTHEERRVRSDEAQRALRPGEAARQLRGHAVRDRIGFERHEMVGGQVEARLEGGRLELGALVRRVVGVGSAMARSRRRSAPLVRELGACASPALEEDRRPEDHPERVQRLPRVRATHVHAYVMHAHVPVLHLGGVRSGSSVGGGCRRRAVWTVGAACVAPATRTRGRRTQSPGRRRARGPRQPAARG
jgi:hypothetical protein